MIYFCRTYIVISHTSMFWIDMVFFWTQTQPMLVHMNGWTLFVYNSYNYRTFYKIDTMFFFCRPVNIITAMLTFELLRASYFERCGWYT